MSTLPVIEEAILSSYREAEISSESKIWKDAMEEEMTSLYKTTLRNSQSCPKERRQLAVSGYMQINKDLLRKILYTTKPSWWRKATDRSPILHI